MKISIVIPAYNEEKYIGDCIDSIKQHGGSLFHEIVVVNNASKDRTTEIATAKGARVVYESNKGLTHARRRGLIEATGDIIAYLDADTRISPNWAPLVTHSFTTNSDLVCLSGPYRYFDGSVWQRSVMHSLWHIFAPIMYRIVGYAVLGGNFVARKSALEQMGGFDTSIAFYGEDTDIARRISRFGKVVFRMDFFVHTSIRRFEKEGLIKANIVYGMNFIWPVLFGRPFTKKYRDIR